MAPEQYSKRRLVPRRKVKGEAVAQKNFHSKGLAPKILGYCNFKPKKRLRKSAHERLNDLEYDDDDIEYHPRGHLVHIIVMEEIADVIGDWLHP